MEVAQHMVFDFYCVALKRNFNLKIRYGQQRYDFDEGVMYFLSPGQVFGMEKEDVAVDNKVAGWMLLFHPDFLWKTVLAKNIKKYAYFGYAVNEALFLSEKEEGIITSLMQHIQGECRTNMDKFSQDIIIAHIEALLNYADRFYNRQFLTRTIAGHQMLEQLEEALNDYFKSGYLSQHGVPTVQELSARLHLSPNYLSSLLKVATGRNTQQHIQDKLIQTAKERISTTALSVNEIAYELGFEHPQSFSRLFKAKTGLSPVAFRDSFS